MSRFLRICNQNVQKVLKRAKKISCQKFNIGIKNAEIHADFESKKFWINAPKKSYQKTCDGNLHFFNFYSCSSNLFAYNFLLVHFLTTFLTDSKSAWNSAQRLKKSKTYFVNVSSILHPSKGLYSSFSKKKSNSLYPNVQLFRKIRYVEFRCQGGGESSW